MASRTATPARRTPTAALDDAQERWALSVSEATRAAGYRVATHLFHVALFVVLVVHRQHTVLALSGAASRAFGDSLGGMPATLLGLWASSYDGLWTAVLGWVL